jgi:hypothetical protein
MTSAALEAAFRATTYRVTTPQGLFDLRIGQDAPAFDDFLRGQGADRWTIVSAVNPRARLLSDEQNGLRQTHLRERVSALGYRFLATLNLADADDWPPEPSLLVLQVAEAQARALAREFSQLAVVCADTGCAPRLVWC